MPLRKGSSSEILGENIAELIRSGHEPAQAAAIAYKASRGEDRAAGILYRAGDSVLLMLRAATTTDFPSTWCFPGGGIELGETPEQTAIRESQEETGYAPGDLLTVLDWDDGFTTFGIILPATFVPALNEEHVGYVWAPLSALPQPLHPGVAATLARLPAGGIAMDAMRVVDGNGWFEVKGNPISKAGIFPYSGRQLGLTGPEADQVFRVLRPPEELADPECIESFKLIPWIDEHVMLGPVAQGKTDRAVPAERKGVQGVIGEDVFFKDGTLFANIKAFSGTLAALIQAGKRELSAGYRCIYDRTAGVWNGLPYDAVQRKIRGNHLALVQEGRMGPDVAVMDRLTFTFDAKEIEMPETQKNQGGAASGAGAMTLEQLVTVVGEIAPQVAKLTEAMAALTGAGAAKAAVTAPEIEDKGAATAATAAPAAEVKEEETVAASMDAMERNLLNRIAQRDALAKQISVHVGTFDHAEKTYAEVVAYGCEKLGIKAEKGQEAAALSGFLQAKPAAVPAAHVSGMDAAHGKREGGSFVDKHLSKGG